MNSVPSENIIKLRELIDKLSCKYNQEQNEAVLEFINTLKRIIDDNRKQLKGIDDTEVKLMAYEAMCYRMVEFLDEYRDNNIK